jgi:hypothetical protein
LDAKPRRELLIKRYWFYHRPCSLAWPASTQPFDIFQLSAMNPKAQRLLTFIAQPVAVILLMALADLGWVWLRDSRVDWYFVDYHGYYADTQEAFFLVLASLALLFNRAWISVFAGLISLRTIYVHVFATLRGISVATDVPMFGADAWRRWWVTFTHQPQYALHLIVAVLILVAALIAIGRWVRCSIEAVSNKSLDRSGGKRLSHQA